MHDIQLLCDGITFHVKASNIITTTITTHQVVLGLLSLILQGHPWWNHYTILDIKMKLCNIIEFSRADWAIRTIARLLQWVPRMIHTVEQQKLVNMNQTQTFMSGKFSEVHQSNVLDWIMHNLDLPAKASINPKKCLFHT